MKNLKNLTWGEVMEGIMGMLETLDIAGSTPSYNIYTAVEGEWRKAKANFRKDGTTTS